MKEHKALVDKNNRALKHHGHKLHKHSKAEKHHKEKKKAHLEAEQNHNLEKVQNHNTITKESKITINSGTGGQPGGINQDKLEKEKMVADFEEIFEKEVAIKEQKAKKAKRLWGIINKHGDEDDKTADFADKIGLPPPPSRYSQHQIDLVKTHMKYKKPVLSFDDKVQCMTILNQAKASSDLSEQAGRDSHILPHKISESKTHTQNYELLMKQFNFKCIGDVNA